MADDFVQQIARLLGQSPEDTHRTLHALADSIRSEVENEGAATIEGLGVFRRDGDALAFEPAPSLAQAVNHRYAGLPALESGPSTAEDETPTAEEPSTAGAAPPAAAVAPPAIVEPAPDANSAEIEQPDADDIEDPFAASDTANLDLAPEPEPEPVRDLSSEPRALQENTEEDDPLPVVEFDTAADDRSEAAALDAHDSETLGLENEPVAEDATVPEDEPFDVPLQGETIDEDAFLADLPDETADERAAMSYDEATAEAVSGADDAVDEDDAEIDALLAGVWSPAPTRTDRPHPLGSMPPGPVEDADYSVMDESDEAEDQDAAPVEPVASEDDEPASEEEVLSTLIADLAADPAPVTARAADHPPPSNLPSPATASAPGFAATASAAATEEVVKPTKRAPRERGRNRAPIYLGMALVVLAALAIFWFTNRGTDNPTVAERTSPATAETAPGGSSIDPGVSTDPAPAVPAPDEATPDATTPEPEPAAPPPPSDDPLRSTAGIDRAEGGFSWIVGSEFSRAPAERRVAAFREQGFRSDVIAEETGGRTRYRVALGQFDSLDEANRLRSNLPAGVPDDTWLLRL